MVDLKFSFDEGLTQMDSWVLGQAYDFYVGFEMDLRFLK